MYSYSAFRVPSFPPSSVFSSPLPLRWMLLTTSLIIIYLSLTIHQIANQPVNCVCQADLESIDFLMRQNEHPLPDRSSSIPARELCSQPGECFPAFPNPQNLQSIIRVSSSHRLLSCVIPKSMSTVMTAVMCFLHDPKAFRQSGRKFINEADKIRFCAGQNEYQSIAEFRRNQIKVSEDQPSPWRFTMITRDPIDRFISGFIDRCIRTPRPPFCNGCHQNMTCFILSEYERFSTQINSNDYPRTFEDMHFLPQHWRCDVREELHNYHFIRYSSDPSKELMHDLFHILRKQNTSSEDLAFIENELAGGRTGHSTVHSNARRYLEDRLRSSPYLMEYIIRMFFHDYRLFNYPLPQGF